jgi:hypothetical protein
MQIPQLVGVKAVVATVHVDDNGKGDCHFAGRNRDDENAEECAPLWNPLR